MGFFVGLGGQKCGSTWLYRYLSERTDAGMLPVKELHWFNGVPRQVSEYDRHFRRHAKRLRERLAAKGVAPNETQLHVMRRARLKSDADYRQLFEAKFDVARQSCGEISASYGLLDAEGLREIDRVFPGVKLFLFCRNPADRFWAGLNWQEKDKASGAAMEALALAGLAGGECLRLTQYELMAQAAIAAVGQSRVFLGFYEELFSPLGSEVLASLCEFLQVSHGEPGLGEIVLGGDYPALDEGLRLELARGLRETYRWAFQHFGRLPPSWRRDLDAVGG